MQNDWIHIDQLTFKSRIFIFNQLSIIRNFFSSSQSNFLLLFIIGDSFFFFAFRRISSHFSRVDDFFSRVFFRDELFFWTTISIEKYFFKCKKNEIETTSLKNHCYISKLFRCRNKELSTLKNYTKWFQKLKNWKMIVIKFHKLRFRQNDLLNWWNLSKQIWFKKQLIENYDDCYRHF